MDNYISVDEVLKNYMRFDHVVNPYREEQLKAYYRKTQRSADPCWKTVLSKHYQIVDYCDVFVNACKEGTVLAIYSSIKHLNSKSASVQGKYPIESLNATAFNYYGLKLNILASLSNHTVNKLILYYDNNKSQTFFVKEIISNIVLDHYREHYMKNSTCLEKKTEAPVLKEIALQLFS